jgi:hypothetical protein
MAQTSDEATIQSLEYRWVDMWSAHDVAGLDALIDDSYIANTPQGKLNKADMLGPRLAGLSQSLKNVKVSVQDDHAQASGENFVTLANGKIARIQFVDQFERKNGKWRVVSSDLTQ